MEIRIKTYEEFRSERVTVQVAPGQRAEIEIVDGEVSKREHLFTSDEVAHYQSTEAELVAGPLQARINDLEDKLVKATIKVQGYDHDRHTERDRADRLKVERDQLKAKVAELENKLMDGHVCTAGCSENQHVAFVGRKALTELENQVGALTRRIDNARIILEDPQVTEIRDEVMARKSVRLADAIGKALDTLTWH